MVKMQVDIPENIEQILRKKRNKTEVVIDILKEYFEKRVSDFERLSVPPDSLLVDRNKGED